MAIGIVFVEVIIHVFQLFIYSICGAGLTFIGVFDKIGEHKSALANLHCFIPLFEMVAFSKSANGLSGEVMGLLFFIFCLSGFIATGIALLYSWVFKMDIRISRVFFLLNFWGDSAFLPEILTDAMCSKNGPLHGDPTCSKVYGYSFFCLFLFNFSLLIFGPYFMHSDKALGLNVTRQMIFVRHFYPKSAQDFLDDPNLTALEKKAIENVVVTVQEPGKPQTDHAGIDLHKNTELVSTASHFVLPNAHLKEVWNSTIAGKVPMSVLDDEELKVYSFALQMDRATYSKFQGHFDKLLMKISPQEFESLFKEVPNPEMAPVLNFQFGLNLFISRPIWGCILGIIFGTHKEIMDWLFFSTENTKLFMGTIVGIQNLAIPFAVMIWGMELVKGFSFKGNNIRLIDLIFLIFNKLVLMPSIGLGIIYGLSRDGIATLDNDRVFLFALYSNFCIPPGLLLLTLFVICGYYAKEGALMMFYATISSIIFSPLFTWAYTGVFNLTFPVGVRYRPGD